LQVADSAIVRKWKWLFVNGCGYKTPISNATDFLILVPRYEKCVNMPEDYGGK